MSDSYLAYQNPVTVDKKLDSESLTVGANTTERERVQISGNTATGIANVITTDPVSNDPGLVVRNIGTSAVVARLGQTMTVQFDPGHTLGSISSIATTVTVKFDPGNTLGKVDQGVGQATSAWLVNSQGTASIFTVSGSTSGISVSGVTLISPSANASFKVYAYSLQTTGAVSMTAKFTNGAGSGPTEFWRPLITASGVTGAQGANLSTGGPGNPIFATGVSTTLALVLDTATLVHYSVAYTKESA